MIANITWKTFEMECPEEQRMAKLLLKWSSMEGIFLLNSIRCDHPRLRETDNWDCSWSDLERISSEEAF
jgi:hypothetical protein